MKLLFLGDSLMEFNDWDDRFPNHEVYNRGIAGETVEGLLDRIDLICSTIPSPGAVFIMTGINNLAMADRNFLPAYRKILKQLIAAWPEARVFVHSLLPVLFPWINNDEIREMNSGLRRLAEEEGVFFVDVRSEFLDEKGAVRRTHLLDDGVHLSNRGYAAWEAVIRRLIA